MTRVVLNTDAGRHTISRHVYDLDLRARYLYRLPVRQ